MERNSRVARLRWNTFMRKQRAQTRLLKKITGDAGEKETLVVYGDASINHTFGHKASTPTTGLRKYIGQRCKVIMQDEFRTSKLCCACHTPLTDIKFPRITKEDGGQPFMVKSHSVRRGGNNDCFRMVWDRDVNAAINILLL